MKMGVTLQRLALSAAGVEPFDIDSYGHAGIALVAKRPIREQAAAPETLFDQPRIGVSVDEMRGRRDLRSRFLIR
jgi:hypothetical protein